MSQDDANELHYRYYREYGLAIEGLVRHHKVDALEYNRKVDDALPLEDIIKPNPELRKLIQDIDTSKVRLWLFTNAYITHGKRVVKLLEVDDLFEGITFCDYGSDKFYCKPHVEMFDKAMKEAGVKSNKNCYFVGESNSPSFACCITNLAFIQMIHSSTSRQPMTGAGKQRIYLMRTTQHLLSRPAIIRYEAYRNYEPSFQKSFGVLRHCPTSEEFRHCDRQGAWTETHTQLVELVPPRSS